jgi:hypothetical protein
MLKVPMMPIESGMGAAMYYGSKAIPQINRFAVPAATGTVLQMIPGEREVEPGAVLPTLKKKEQ